MEGRLPIVNTHVVLSQKARAELEIVLQVKRTASLELHAKGSQVQAVGHLLDGADLPELLVLAVMLLLLMCTLRDRQARRPPVTPAVVRVADGGRRCRRRVLLMGIVVVRHYQAGCAWRRAQINMYEIRSEIGVGNVWRRREAVVAVVERWGSARLSMTPRLGRETGDPRRVACFFRNDPVRRVRWELMNPAGREEYCWTIEVDLRIVQRREKASLTNQDELERSKEGGKEQRGKWPKWEPTISSRGDEMDWVGE